jgi:hypothetical protein
MTTKALTGVVAALTLITVVVVSSAVLVAGATSLCGSAASTGPAWISPSPSTSASPRSTEPAAASGGCPGQVLARAASWLTAWHGGPVPYLSSSQPETWLDGYRRDCSGYASMGLPGPGLDAAALAARSTPIAKADLLPGNLLINPAPDRAGHVVIFDHWSDATMASYVGYEQSGDRGTHHRSFRTPTSVPTVRAEMAERGITEDGWKPD